jgi:hypothetical protein
MLGPIIRPIPILSLAAAFRCVWGSAFPPTCMPLYSCGPRWLSPSFRWQVCFQRFTDRYCSTPMRRLLLRPLRALLHDPRAMSSFVSPPQSSASTSGQTATPEIGQSPRPPPPPLESVYRRVLRMLSFPLPRPLLTPLHDICKMVFAWEQATDFRTLVMEVGALVSPSYGVRY